MSFSLIFLQRLQLEEYKRNFANSSKYLRFVSFHAVGAFYERRREFRTSLVSNPSRRVTYGFQIKLLVNWFWFYETMTAFSHPSYLLLFHCAHFGVVSMENPLLSAFTMCVTIFVCCWSSSPLSLMQLQNSTKQKNAFNIYRLLAREWESVCVCAYTRRYLL